MKNLCQIVVPVLAILVLSSCGSDESARTDPTATQSTFDPMVGTVDKARVVEDLSADRTEQLDKEIDKSQ